MNKLGRARLVGSAAALALCAACGDGGGDSGSGEDSAELDPQTPPTEVRELKQWLAAWEDEGWEGEWMCEDAPTAKTEGAAAIHVHNDANGKNRVCNNQRLAATAPGELVPKGSAALKFVGDAIYVEVKIDADSQAGAGWFWSAPGGEPAGVGISECSTCHSAAGSDDDHPGFGDYVYFQVK